MVTPLEDGASPEKSIGSQPLGLLQLRTFGEACIYLVSKNPAAQDLPVDNAIFVENI